MPSHGDVLTVSVLRGALGGAKHALEAGERQTDGPDTVTMASMPGTRSAMPVCTADRAR
jgi:hypothetical protein